MLKEESGWQKGLLLTNGNKLILPVCATVVEKLPDMFGEHSRDHAEMINDYTGAGASPRG